MKNKLFFGTPEKKVEDKFYAEQDLKPFAFVKAIQHHRQSSPMDFSREEVVKAYSPYIMNRFMSMNPSCIFDANEMNRAKDVPVDKQFLFYDRVVPKSSEYFPYIKKDGAFDSYEKKCIDKYYEFGTKDSMWAGRILDASQRKTLVSKFDGPKIK